MLIIRNHPNMCMKIEESLLCTKLGIDDEERGGENHLDLVNACFEVGLVRC